MISTTERGGIGSSTRTRNVSENTDAAMHNARQICCEYEYKYKYKGWRISQADNERVKSMWIILPRYVLSVFYH